MFVWRATSSSHFAWRSTQTCLVIMFCVEGDKLFAFCLAGCARLVKFVCMGGDKLLTLCLTGCAKVAHQICSCGGRQDPHILRAGLRKVARHYGLCGGRQAFRILLGGLRKGGSSNLFVWGATGSSAPRYFHVAGTHARHNLVVGGAGLLTIFTWRARALVTILRWGAQGSSLFSRGGLTRSSQSRGEGHRAPRYFYVTGTRALHNLAVRGHRLLAVYVAGARASHN